MGTSFFKFLKAKEQRLDWAILLLSCLVGYIALKLCYPYPTTISDSNTYVAAAISDTFMLYRPFGYSYLLQILHTIAPSIHSIFAGQMILYFISASAFVFSVKYFYPPKNKWLWTIILFFFVFSPMHFYMANAIMSDLLFAMLIYLFLAAALFVIHKHSYLALGIFIVCLYFSLHTRYSAIIFPIVFIPAFFFIKDKIKWVAIASVLLVSVGFYFQMKSTMEKAVGLYQYSTGFDGWQLTSNAIHIIPFVDWEKEEKLEREDLQGFHEYMIQFEDVILKETKNGTDPNYMFIWSNELPLKQFMNYQLQYNRSQGNDVPYPAMWANLGGGLYKDYGQTLILKYPWKFMRYYYLLNMKQIFHPTKTGVLSYFRAFDFEEGKTWYQVSKEAEMKPNAEPYKSGLADFLSITYILNWILILTLGIAAIVFRKEIKWTAKQKLGLITISAFAILYYSSTVFASPIEFRFWLSMCAPQFMFIYVLGNEILEILNKRRREKQII